MLSKLTPTLPTSWYWDEQQYQREIAQIWKREWVCAGHASQWPRAGAYRRVSLGGEQLIVVRQKDDSFRAFFNTCRHRGARLCGEDEGQLRAGRILCPYHAWAYGLDGSLLKAPRSETAEDFDASQFSLYQAPLQIWRGFVFVSLAENPRGGVDEFFDAEANELDDWPLEQLEHVHGESHDIACNWKVFWENYMECYHCPGVHPELCKMVPSYGVMANSREDIPEGHELRDADSRLADGLVTWTADGKSRLPWFEGMGESHARAGMHFTTHLPSSYIVAHVDYVRLVRMLPLAPERTRLYMDWMVAPGVVGNHDVDIEHLVSASRQVVLEDGQIAEVNQQGLRCSRHQSGVLMPLEYEVKAVHDWFRERLDPE